MKDLKSRDTWMVFKIMGEFVEGFETLRDLGPAVSIFGGARFKAGDPEYQLAVDVAERLAQEGYAVITGGGPGIMEAANRGAALAGAKSVGLNIKLPHEQGGNPFVNVKVDFDYFFARKVMFMRYAQAYVCLPGGFGTLDEVSEALTLIQTAKIRNFPVVLVGRSFWKGLVAWIKNTMIPAKTISPADLALFTLVDTPDEAVEAVRKGHAEFEKRRTEREDPDETASAPPPPPRRRSTRRPAR
jgi:uncharacterized protein (TIGR00730 family)